MLRSSLIVAGAALLCTTAFAQSKVDSNRVHPLNSQVKNAGSVDIVTGKWTPAGMTTKAQTNVFNNTCFFDSGTGYIYYTTSESCEEFYDEGEVPASNNTIWQGVSTGLGGSGGGTADNQTVNTFEFSYCVDLPTQPDIEIAFWDNLLGDCVGFAPPTNSTLGHWSKAHGTPGGGTNAPTAYFDLSGIGLPGSSTTGALACWFVTITNFGFTLNSDGDGSFDNDGANDKFIWAMRNNDVPASGHGWLITGDPNVIPAGSCTYDIPCMTDWTGGVCGSGYGGFDGWWTNSDGGVAAGCSAGAAASGCYYFGGYPTNLMGGFYLRVEAEVNPGGPSAYCTSRVSSLGCQPTFSASVIQITKGAGGSVIAPAGPVPGGNSPGILFASKTLLGTPIQVAYGELCLQGFFRAPTTIKPAGGTSGTCSGAYQWDLQVLVNNASAAQAQPGDSIYVQGWYRDTPNPGGANFTNALGTFAIL